MLYCTTKNKILITSFVFFILIIGNCQIAEAQFLDKFEDGNISTNPLWQGNTDHFIVNNEAQLQLNAVAAGESYIFSEYSLPGDSLEIDLYFKMTFDPSDNNLSIIYLAMDQSNTQAANGYYIRLGENGTNDNIKFYRSDAGVPVLLASCTMAAISKDPAQARLKIRISKNGLWQVETNYQGGNLLIPDVEFMDTGIFNFSQNVFFGIYCKYTSTRLKNFFFDDLSIQKWVPDTTPPQLATVSVVDEKTLDLTFSERLDATTALNVNHYKTTPDLGAPASASFGSGENIIRLVFAQSIQSGIEYLLKVENVTDPAGNSFTGQSSFFRTVTPLTGELIINEILTDPVSGGEDFIEIYNRSTKFIELKGLIVRNASKNEEKPILNSRICKPGEYVAINKDTSFLKQNYNTPAEARFVQNDLPSMNVSDAHIQILAVTGGQKTVIDSFEYKESFHYSLLNDTKGVSLERIFQEGPSNDPQNWHSASATTGYATPGYKNSNFRSETISGDDEISIPEKIFSPYQSGNTPYLLIHYNVEKGGYLATIKIFDTEGLPVRNLTNNELIGFEGVLRWDGLDDEQQPVRMGWYIVASQLFHPDGEVKNFKHTVIAGDR